MGVGARGVAAVAVAALLLVSASAAAQAPSRQAKDKTKETPKSEQKTREEGKKVFTRPASGEPGAADATGAGWTIIAESFVGSDAAAQASARVRVVSDALSRSDVWVRTTPRGAAVVVGSYAGARDAAIRADLTQVRGAVVGGTTPFAQAFIAPPAEARDPGEIPDLNLSAAAGVYGLEQAQYTLQIAVYESPKREEAKRAAEEGALRLRREGEPAFYYHGPTRSMVTVGVFGDGDFDAGLRPKSSALIGLQSRYPLNLLNGQFPIVEKRRGEADRQQPSTLVKIP